MHNGLNQHPQLVFSEAFACGPQPPRRHPSATGDPCTKAATRELTASFRDHHHYFQPQPQPQQPPPPQASQFRHQWSANSRSSGGDASEEDDAEDDNDDDDDEEEEEEEEEEELENNLENIVTVAKISDSNQKERYNDNSNIQKMKHISALGDLNEIKALTFSFFALLGSELSCVAICFFFVLHLRNQRRKYGAEWK